MKTTLTYQLWFKIHEDHPFLILSTTYNNQILNNAALIDVIFI